VAQVLRRHAALPAPLATTDRRLASVAGHVARFEVY
jgi:hypothetical protein